MMKTVHTTPIAVALFLVALCSLVSVFSFPRAASAQTATKSSFTGPYNVYYSYSYVTPPQITAMFTTNPDGSIVVSGQKDAPYLSIGYYLDNWYLPSYVPSNSSNSWSTNYMTANSYVQGLTPSFGVLNYPSNAYSFNLGVLSQGSHILTLTNYTLSLFQNTSQVLIYRLDFTVAAAVPPPVTTFLWGNTESVSNQDISVQSDSSFYLQVTNTNSPTTCWYQTYINSVWGGWIIYPCSSYNTPTSVTLATFGFSVGTNYLYFMSRNSAGDSASVARTITVTDPTPTTFTVSYGANGATSGTVPDSQTKIYGTDLTLQTNSGSLTHTGGYTFAGWNTATNGTGTDYSAGGTYSANAAVTLYPKWTLSNYTLTVNKIGSGYVSVIAYGSSSGVDLMSIACGTACSTTNKYGTRFTLDATSSAGYTFTGWSGCTTTGVATSLCSVDLLSDTTVTATFAPIIPTVDSLTASPNPVPYNTASTLTWEASGGVTACYMSGGIYLGDPNAVTPGDGYGTYVGGASGSVSTGNLTVDTKYKVNCYNGVSWALNPKSVTVSLLSTLKACVNSCTTGAGAITNLAMGQNDTRTIVACYNAATACDAPDNTGNVTLSSTWTESGTDVVSLSNQNVGGINTKKFQSGTAYGTETITIAYLTQSVTLDVTVPCIETVACDSEQNKACSDKTVPAGTTISGICGTVDCSGKPGKRYCDLNWKEVAP